MKTSYEDYIELGKIAGKIGKGDTDEYRLKMRQESGWHPNLERRTGDAMAAYCAFSAGYNATASKSAI
jgi:hypothetical protein